MNCKLILFVLAPYRFGKSGQTTIARHGGLGYSETKHTTECAYNPTEPKCVENIQKVRKQQISDTCNQEGYMNNQKPLIYLDNDSRVLYCIPEKVKFAVHTFLLPSQMIRCKQGHHAVSIFSSHLLSSLSLF